MSESLGLDSGDRELWSMPSGGVLYNVHPGAACRGRACPIHNPSDGPMSSWPQIWRDDRGIFERVCDHRIGHPDPDQLEYWRETGQKWQAVHGCCGCCRTATT